jgi:hypothetical protein
MALSHVWSNARRVITQGLVVTFDKELRHAVNSQNISHPYWHYKRRRTMEMEYLGLTRSAAEACCAAWNKALYRRAWRQVWISNAAAPGDSSSIIGYWSSANNVTDWNDESQFDFIRGGTAKLSYDGGKGWKVSVSIDETLPYNHKTFIFNSGGRGDFLEFEDDPTAPCQAFRWGGTVMAAGESNEDFSLDAAEYQLALLTTKITSLSSTPFLAVEYYSGRSNAGLDSLTAQVKTNQNSPWISCGTPAFNHPICFSLPDGSIPRFARLRMPVGQGRGLERQYTFSNVMEVK